MWKWYILALLLGRKKNHQPIILGEFSIFSPHKKRIEGVLIGWISLGSMRFIYLLKIYIYIYFNLVVKCTLSIIIIFLLLHFQYTETYLLHLRSLPQLFFDNWKDRTIYILGYCNVWMYMDSLCIGKTVLGLWG